MLSYLHGALGFKGVEWGSSVPEQHTVQEIVEAREKAGIQVVGLCTPAGSLHHVGFVVKQN